MRVTWICRIDIERTINEVIFPIADRNIDTFKNFKMLLRIMYSCNFQCIIDIKTEKLHLFLAEF